MSLVLGTKERWILKGRFGKLNPLLGASDQLKTCVIRAWCKQKTWTALLTNFTFGKAMKGKRRSRFFFHLVILVQYVFCHPHLETNSELLCCEKLTNTSDFRCWNETSEMNSTANTAVTGHCVRGMSKKTCFKATLLEPCRENPMESIIPLGKREIHIGAFVPFLKDDRNGYYNAMKMAIDIINNRSDILQNYTLVLDVEDTAWDDGAHAIKAFYKLLNKERRPAILLGPSSTEALEPVAEAAPLWYLIQVSYASGSPKFDSGMKYRNTYLGAPSSTSYSKAKVAFIKYFGWKRVAILYQYDPEFFSPTVNKLKNELKKNNISIIAVEGFEQLGDVSFQIRKLKSLDARIIIGEFGYIGAQNVFCEAFKQKMYGPNYAWITFGGVAPSQIFRSPDKEKIPCTVDELRQAADRYISMVKLDIRQDDNVTFSGMTAEGFWSEMLKLNKNKSLRKESAYAFDVAWIIALTLNASLANGLEYENLHTPDYKYPLGMKQLIRKISFQGLTGPVRFEDNRERLGIVLIKQNRKGNETRIGQHFTFSDQLHIFKDEKKEIWPDKIPKDDTVRNFEFMIIPLPLIVIMWLMAVVGIICSAGFLYFNISNRKHRVIKMSSPKLNNIIILGCILCYASVVLLGLDARFLDIGEYGYICNARTTVLSFGFSLSFGAMFSKTWRVHKIFTAAKTLKKMAIRDFRLLVIVASLLLVDLVFLSTWVAIDPLKTEILRFEELTQKEQDVIIIPALFQCTCRYKTYFLGVLFGYKGILLLFGLFLAWETRNVTIPALNDSRYIGMSVYNVVVLSIIGAIVAIALDGSMYYKAPYAVSSLCLIVCTTATLLLVFVPKMYQFLTKDESLTTQAPGMHIGQTRKGATSNSFNCGTSPVLRERNTSFTCKGTQTDCDVPGSAGLSSDEEPLLWNMTRFTIKFTCGMHL